MNVSICITTLNEQGSISKLLDSLIDQSIAPAEIFIVDGGSSDNTLQILKHYQKRYKNIKVVSEPCSRSKGRNLAVELSRNEIIAMTDAGCVPKKDWLENLCEPFKNNSVDVSAGFYKMKSKNDFEKAESFFLGVLPYQFNNSFLPSTRSIAFRKEIWEEVGGFPENINDCAEDTVFNYKLLKIKAKFARVKTAVVEWGMPTDITGFFKKIFNYAKGDAKSKIYVFPSKYHMSHNIRIIVKISFYILLLFLLSYQIYLNHFPIYFLILFLFYLFWIFRKLYFAFRKIKVSVIGVFLQFVCDAASISGFIVGNIK